MSIVIIDYGSGNLRSAKKAFSHMADKAGGRSVIVTSDPQTVRAGDHIILPGVGSFGDCYAGLAAIDGMIETLHDTVLKGGRPFLGICVGMQLMCARGLERGTHQGLGWFEADVTPLNIDTSLKVPHMGWNNLSLARAHKIFDGLEGADMYFVHSYAAQTCAPDMLASVDYGGPVIAAMGRDNMVGTQFHPEKSQQNGLRLISNFLEWRP